MKKNLFPLIAGLGLAVSAQAGTLLLNEPFAYGPGALTTVSAGLWVNHSGTAGQVDVASGKVNLTQSESEDVNALLAAYSTTNLYASFVVNFSALPAGVGEYFAHFKNVTTSNFRCRVFANTNGTDGTKFRVGITRGASGATPVYIATDLSLNTDYKLVVRYNALSAESTLWLNPGSESAIGDRADALDSTTTNAIVAFALRQVGQNPSMGTLTLDDLKVGTNFTDVVAVSNPALNPPFISLIPNQSIPRNGVTPAVPLYVTDGETAPASLTLSAVSSSPTLVPDNNVVFGPMNPGDSNRTVMVTAGAGEQGVSEITATVTDGDGNTASRKFLVIVGAPTLSTFTNIATPKDTPTPILPFTVNDGEGDAITLSASSTNEAVVPVSGILFGSSGGLSNITITPAAGASGLSRVTIIANDGYNTVSNSFVITVFQTFHVVLCDDFNSYPNGALTNVSTIWTAHSGSAADLGYVTVMDGKILLSGTNSQDVSSTFTNPPSFTAVSFFPHEGWILYSRFKVNFSARPTAANGEYFAHFRNSGSGFGSRVFATTNGVAAGKLRLGISNNTGAPASVLFPTDLEVGATYTVVTRYNVGTGQSTLWINPNTEGDPSVTATDSAFPFTAETYAFREQSGIGNMAIDDVKISTAFADVVQSLPVLTITPSGTDVMILWTGTGTLQYADDLTSPPASIVWVSLTGQPSPYTIPPSGLHRFYRVTVP